MPLKAEFRPPIPSPIAHMLAHSVRREWLDSRVDLALSADSGGRIALVTGEPGCGKTIFAAMAAARWNCPCLILRGGGADGAITADPKNALIMLGLQIRELLGDEAFGSPAIQIRSKTTAKEVAAGGTLVGVDIGKVRLSPFKRVLIESEVRIGSLEGHAGGLRIGELSDAAAELTVAQLAREAIIEPLSWLAESRPNSRVHIVIDALDESPGLARVLPLGIELPENSSLLITARPGAHLDRFVSEVDGQITKIDLDDMNVRHLELADVRNYVFMRVNNPVVTAAIERRRPVDDVVQTITEASEGNFLYLHHVLFGLEEAAGEGRLLPALTDDADPPRGLDAIYSYQVSSQLRAAVDDSQRSSFRRVLGVLAVQFAPLTARQIASFAAVAPEFVDEVVARIAQFIERVDAVDDLGYTFYHPSFADFLLTQDRSRNPFPLEPAREHHLRIASYYASWTDQDWRDCDDIYALTHLADHAAVAEVVSHLAALGAGAFLRRQWELIGPSAAMTTTISAARLAASHSQDETFLDMLRRSYDFVGDMAQEWASGGFTLSLLTNGPATQARLRAGGPQAPWSGFLCAERLLDLGRVGDALDLLDSVVSRPWPGYRPEKRPTTRGVSGTVREGLIFDLPDEIVASFLGRVAELDPDLALRINRRLNGGRPWDQIPNVQSGWRDTLNALVARDPGPDACRAAVDVTNAWMLRRAYPVGRAGIADALYVLLARMASEAPSDVEWFGRQLLIVVQLRYMAPAGLREEIWLDGAIANLAGLVGVMEAAPAGSALRGLVEEAAVGLAEGLPTLSMPAEFSYDRRAGILGRYAYLLNRADLPRWRKVASIALRACELDASSNDPPRDAIAFALHWLGAIPDRKVAARARALAVRLGLTAKVAEVNAPDEPTEISLAALRASRSPYGKGRLALKLWQQNSATLADLAGALPVTPSSGSRSEPPALLSDLAAEALAEAAETLPVDWALAAIDRLCRGRTESRQRHVELDALTMRSSRWQRLTELGRTDLVLSELHAAWTAALSRGAVNTLVLCCSCAAPIDPALAIEWWRKTVPRLVPEDLGIAAATAAVAFADSAPGYLAELTKVEVGPKDALDACQMWVLCPALRLAAADVMRGVVDRLDPTAAEADGKLLAKHVWLAAAVPSDDEPLSAIANELAAKVLRLWQSNAELAVPILENCEYGFATVAGPGADAIVKILAHTLDVHDSSGESALKMDLSAIMRAATWLKEVAPAMSRRSFELVQHDWTGMLDPEYGNTPEAIGVMLASVIAFLETEFNSAHERTLYESTVRLTRWCCQPLASPAEVAQLQEAIGRVPNQDLRSLLMAPVAAAWLRLGDHSLARVTAEQCSLAALHRAGYLRIQRLPGAIRAHIIELITRDAGQVPGEVIGDLLLAWFRLRLKESDPLDYFGRIEQWIAANQP